MILQAIKVIISVPMNEYCWIWVWLPVTSLKDLAPNTQEMFDWVLIAVKTYLGRVRTLKTCEDYMTFHHFLKNSMTLDKQLSSGSSVKTIIYLTEIKLIFGPVS